MNTNEEYELQFRMHTNTRRGKETQEYILRTLGWNHPYFRKVKRQIETEDYFITNPLEIDKGVLTCKCGSQKTISFQRQTRSADEGFTTFAQCVECGNRWRQN